MKNKGIVLALMTMVISGVSVFANGQLIKGMDPIVQTTIKNGLVGLMVIGWILITKKINKFKKLPIKQWLKLMVIALVGGSLSFGLFFTGLKIVGASDGALIHKTMVFWIAIMAIPFLKEKISKWMMIAVLALYASNFLNGVTFGLISVSHLMVLTATLLWSIEAILIKKYLKQIDTDLILFGRMGLGAIILFGYLTVTGKVHLLFNVTNSQWQGLSLVSLLLFGYVMTWYRAIKQVSPVLVSSILVGATVITTSLTSLSTGKVTAVQLIQSLIISGVISTMVVIVLKQSNLKKEKQVQIT